MVTRSFSWRCVRSWRLCRFCWTNTEASASSSSTGEIPLLLSSFFYRYNMYLHRAFTSLFLFMWVLLLNSVKSNKGLTKSLACTNGLKNGMPILALSLILGSCTTTTHATTITSSVSTSTSCLFISENLFSYRSNGHPNSHVILCV